MPRGGSKTHGGDVKGPTVMHLQRSVALSDMSSQIFRLSSTGATQPVCANTTTLTFPNTINCIFSVAVSLCLRFLLIKVVAIRRSVLWVNCNAHFLSGSINLFKKIHYIFYSYI